MQCTSTWRSSQSRTRPARCMKRTSRSANPTGAARTATRAGHRNPSCPARASQFSGTRGTACGSTGMCAGARTWTLWAIGYAGPHVPARVSHSCSTFNTCLLCGVKHIPCPWFYLGSLYGVWKELWVSCSGSLFANQPRQCSITVCCSTRKPAD
jgi:hypothetical protein